MNSKHDSSSPPPTPPSFEQESSGFTLIEVLVSASLLSIVAVGVGYQQAQQIQARNQNKVEMQARQNINETLSRLAVSSADFPAITDASGYYYGYVGCYDDDGAMKANVSGITGFVATPIPSPTSSIAAQIPGICPTPGQASQTDGGIEVRIVREDTTNQNKVTVRAIPINKLSGGQDARGFKMRTMTYSSVANFGTAPTAGSATTTSTTTATVIATTTTATNLATFVPTTPTAPSTTTTTLRGKLDVCSRNVLFGPFDSGTLNIGLTVALCTTLKSAGAGNMDICADTSGASGSYAAATSHCTEMTGVANKGVCLDCGY